MVTITEMQYDMDAGIWTVSAVVELADGTRSGSYQIRAPESANAQELAAATLALFTPSSR